MRSCAPMLAAALFAAFFGQALASGASPWSRSVHSSLRLLDGGPAPGSGRLAGIEIALAPDFKTYWRSPGESGLPPLFDWSASSNVRQVTVLWPVPVRFSDGSGTSVGYAESVVLPLIVSPEDDARPVDLRVRADYGVCSTLCIPGHGRAELTLVPGVPADAERRRRIEGFLARVPASATAGEDRVPRVLRAAAVGKAIEIETLTASSSREPDIFVEAAEGWYFGTPVPKVVSADAAVRRILWAVPVLEAPKEAVSAGLPLVVTVPDGESGIEVRLNLDGAGAAR
jgi:DsbC/DsbD-like thiol-disulfide interchange protein